MSLVAPRPRRLYQQIAGRLQTMIQEGDYGPGTRLPAERDLAKQLGVGRPSIREAIIALEIAGLVEVRLGSGVYVTGATTVETIGNGDGVDPGPGVHEVLDARRLVEGETAFRAALSATPAQLDALRATIESMRIDAEKPEVRGEVDGDRQFHLTIAQASGNSALAAIVTDLWNTRNGPMWNHWFHRARTVPAHLRRVAEHQEIYERLAARDPDGARAAMQKHIDSVVRRFMRK